MAEAHQAVAFSFAITHEGVHVNYDREVLHVIWHAGIRSWSRSFRRILVSIICFVPILLLNLYIFLLLIYNREL